jgi:hypothetical protein
MDALLRAQLTRKGGCAGEGARNVEPVTRCYRNDCASAAGELMAGSRAAILRVCFASQKAATGRSAAR